MKLHIQLLILIFMLSCSEKLEAQFILNYEVNSNIIAGGGKYTPFYLLNNRHGVVPIYTNNGFLEAAIYKENNPKNRFSYSFGFNMIGTYGGDAAFYIQEAYVGLKYRALGLMIGTKEESSLIESARLSGGGMIWSGNARPVPQLRIGIPHFTNVPFTNDWLQIKGEIAYGFFAENRYQRKTHGENMPYVQNSLYHRKYMLLKIEKNFPLYGLIGIDMAVQFGGVVYDLIDVPLHFPSDFKTFLKVFVPLSGGQNSPLMDQVNVVGNHLGSYLMELGYKLKDRRVKVYYEHYFDDHSGMVFRNFPDGLWGVEFSSDKKSIVEGGVFEILSTTNQSGPFLWDKNDRIPIQVSGGDNYYAHGAYNGWTYRGRTMGTPYITSPDYNSDGFLGFRSSRTRAFHLGFNGYINREFEYRLLSGYTQGWGTFNLPFLEVKKNWSFMSELNYRPKSLKGFTFNVAFAMDKGSLMGDNWGVQFGVRKSGILLNR